MTTQTKTRQSATRPAIAAGSETSRLNAATADEVKRGFYPAETRGRAGFRLHHSAPLQDLNDNVQPRKGEGLAAVDEKFKSSESQLSNFLNFAAAPVFHPKAFKKTKTLGRFQTQEADEDTHCWQSCSSDHTLSVWMMFPKHHGNFSALEFIFSGPERNPKLWLGVRRATSRTG